MTPPLFGFIWFQWFYLVSVVLFGFSGFIWFQWFYLVSVVSYSTFSSLMNIMPPFLAPPLLWIGRSPI
jgi:hypothetical protein